MSDIPPKTIKMGVGCKEIEGLKASPNLYVSEKVLQTVNKLGSLSDLAHLRQLDQGYYKTLNPTYLDAEDKCIRFFIGPSVQTVGKNIKQITPQNWTEKVFHIFRKLEYSMDIRQLQQSEHFSKEISTQLVPYTTTLRINTVPLQQEQEHRGKAWADFVNKFTLLKNLEIDCRYPFGQFNGAPDALALSLDELEIGLTNLLLKPRIKLYVTTFGHEHFLAKFVTKENVTFELDFLITPQLSDFGPSNMEKFQDVAQEYWRLENINYKIKILPQVVRNRTQLEAFTEVCVHLNSQIKTLELSLSFCEGIHEFEDGDELSIRNCLAQISPYVNDLTISRRMKPAWKILSADSEWPKLTKLRIAGYEEPLGMLKNCPKLEKLELYIDYDSCIFSNIQQTDKENLLEYFGNLGNLTELTLAQKDGNKIVQGNELHEYMRMILPELRTIKYWSLPPPIQ